jgi:hypothetical protein
MDADRTRIVEAIVRGEVGSYLTDTMLARALPGRVD